MLASLRHPCVTALFGILQDAVSILPPLILLPSPSMLHCRMHAVNLVREKASLRPPLCHGPLRHPPGSCEPSSAAAPLPGRSMLHGRMHVMNSCEIAL